jgi:hypothetical protein
VAAVPAMNSRRCPLIKEHANPCGWALKRPSLQQAFEGAWPGPESVTRESALGPISDLGGRNYEVRFTSMSRHRQAASAGPKSAKRRQSTVQKKRPIRSARPRC